MNWLLVIIVGSVTLLATISAIRYLKERFFLSFGTWLDNIFRKLDNVANSQDRMARKGIFNTEGHSPLPPVLVIFVLIYTIYGPTLSPPHMVVWVIVFRSARTLKKSNSN